METLFVFILYKPRTSLSIDPTWQQALFQSNICWS